MPVVQSFLLQPKLFSIGGMLSAHILPAPDESPEKSHSQCCEKFYRREIETGIKSESSKTEGDRNNVIELLKRIEDQSAADEDELSDHSDGENEEDSLAHRLSAIDIREPSLRVRLQVTNGVSASASADDLLRLLTKKERDKFFVALKDPSSGLVRELLKSVELEKTRRLPWWDAPTHGGESPLSLPVPYGLKPSLTVVPTDLINPASRSVSLLYNICAVLYVLLVARSQTDIGNRTLVSRTPTLLAI